MTDRPASNVRTRPIPTGRNAMETLDDFDVYYQTRLPVLRKRAAQLQASRRRNMEILFKALGVHPPFD